MPPREPKWHKPRTALAASLGFGAFVIAGALVFGEPNMLAFGALAASYGVAVYAIDCAVHRLSTGVIRPPEVLRADVTWASACGAIGTVGGLASPLYVG